MNGALPAELELGTVIGAQKNLEFQHAIWASSSHILLVLHELYDLVGEWLG